MDFAELGPRYVQVLVERPSHPALIAAARALGTGEPVPTEMVRYAASNGSDVFVIDTEFGALPIGFGRGTEPDGSVEILDPDKSEVFLVRAYIRRNSEGLVPHEIEKGLVYSDPAIGSHLVCGTSRFVGKTSDVQLRLDTTTLSGNGLDGSKVAIAIMDSGIFLPHITEQPGSAPDFDLTHSWRPNTIVTEPGMHRLGHGTMCAYDAVIAAPKATLLDFAVLLGREPGDHTAPGTMSSALQAYWVLLFRWVLVPAWGGQRPYKTVVVSNSWGIFHPSLDLAKPHPWRYIDNPIHPFRGYIRALSNAGIDVVFAASNCGNECPSAVCIGESTGMIMGANAYDEVLTLAGCDINNLRVGYSSRGPSIANMPPKKPDLAAYTHFLGSKGRGSYLPDGGTSASCAVAAGCLAALRTKLPPGLPSSQLFQALKATAHKVGGGGWNPEYGHGVINPVAAGRVLGVIP